MISADKVISLLERYGLLIIHKVTRAGATTSIILFLINHDLKFVVLEPTNRIIKRTILTLGKYLKGKTLNIVHVPSNRECWLIKEEMKRNKHLKRMPYQFLPKECGPKCIYYNECPVTRILREENIDGVALTYDKLAALMLSPSEEGIPKQIFDKIMEYAGYVLLDEGHELVYDKISSLDINKKHGREYARKLLEKIDNLRNQEGNKFDDLKYLILNYLAIIENPGLREKEVEILELMMDTNIPSHEKLQAQSIPNPYPNVALERINIEKKGSYEPNLMDKYVKMYLTIKDLTRVVGKSNIKSPDVIALCRMLDIITSETLTIHCQHKYKYSYVKGKKVKIRVLVSEICVVDGLRTEALKNFRSKNSKILITSATLVDYNFSKLLESEEPIKEVMFGPNGDPLNTNSKMTIFADTKSFSNFGKYSTNSYEEEIKQKCIDIMDIYGAENCLIICKNKEDWRMVKKLFKDTTYKPKVTYYRASAVMGVESDRRVGILIGLAHKPGHAFDSMRNTAEKSQILKEESMHADVDQAASRVKDPAGIEPSIVFALGCREDYLNNAFHWGIRRSVSISPITRGQKKSVNVMIRGEQVSKPTIVFENEWPETLIASVLCKNYLYSTPQKVPYINNNGTFQTYEYKINSQCSLIDAFFDHKQVSISRKDANKRMLLTDNLLAKHSTRKVKFDFYTLQPDNTVNFLMFESRSEYAISRLKLFLDNLGIPYVIERLTASRKIKQNADNLRVWILLNNTSADKARDFAESILKIAGFNIRGDKEIEYYPRQTKRNTHDIGERISMPFGINSQILVDGKFVKDFDEFTLGCVDLSSQPSDLKANKWINEEAYNSSVAFDA
jgi:hypothetical protein